MAEGLKISEWLMSYITDFSDVVRGLKRNALGDLLVTCKVAKHNILDSTCGLNTHDSLVIIGRCIFRVNSRTILRNKKLSVLVKDLMVYAKRHKSYLTDTSNGRKQSLKIDHEHLIITNLIKLIEEVIDSIPDKYESYGLDKKLVMMEIIKCRELY